MPMSTALREWRLTTPEDARAILEHFNSFHDGFIKSFLLTSRDSFERSSKGAGQVVTGLFDAELGFAHFNYGNGSTPHDRIVRASFSGVADVLLDLRLGKGRFSDWSIDRLEIGVCGGDDRGFSLTVRRRVLTEGSRWQEETSSLFRFQSAVFFG